MAGTFIGVHSDVPGNIGSVRVLLHCSLGRSVAEALAWVPVEVWNICNLLLNKHLCFPMYISCKYACE